MLIPQPRSFTHGTGIAVSLAGTASAAPLLLFIPGFKECLVAQAAKWGPRWHRGFAHIQPASQRVWGKTRVEPVMKKSVQIVEPTCKKSALAVDKKIKAFLAKHQ